MIIDCIADLHGHYPHLEGGDLLIVAGDLIATDTEKEYNEFSHWLTNQNYKKKIVIAGNHDNLLIDFIPKVYKCPIFDSELFEYLTDSGTEFEGLKIWGSPWTKTFEGMNPKCKAFTVDTEEELADKWAIIPEDVDILVTHSPPYGILDKIDFSEGEASAFSVGSKSLAYKIYAMDYCPQICIFGHVHESYGEKEDLISMKKCLGFTNIKFINASHVNERYEPVNKPIRVIL